MATDYFTKWVKVVLIKIANQQAVFKFIKENMIHRFGLLKSIMTDQGTMFIGEEMKEFAKEHGIKLFHSTSYYA